MFGMLYTLTGAGAELGDLRRPDVDEGYLTAIVAAAKAKGFEAEIVSVPDDETPRPEAPSAR
jgi:hypothetical protein